MQKQSDHLGVLRDRYLRLRTEAHPWRGGGAALDYWVSWQAWDNGDPPRGSQSLLGASCVNKTEPGRRGSAANHLEVSFAGGECRNWNLMVSPAAAVKWTARINELAHA